MYRAGLLRPRDRPGGGGGRAAARPSTSASPCCAARLILRAPGRPREDAQGAVPVAPALRAGGGRVPAAAVWLLSVSLKTKAGVYEYPPQLGARRTRRFANYAFVLGAHAGADVSRATARRWRSWPRSRPWPLGIPAAYVLSRERFSGAEALLGGLLAAAQMVSPDRPAGARSTASIARARGSSTPTPAWRWSTRAVQVPFTIIVLKNFFDALPPSRAGGGAPGRRVAVASPCGGSPCP